MSSNIYTKAIRLFNFLFDLGIIYFLIVPFLIDPIIKEHNYVIDNTSDTALLIRYRHVITIFIYYLLFEYVFNRTISKMVSQTKVVGLNGNKPTLLAIVIRTVVRFIPFFDLFSFLGDKGLHDDFSETKIVFDPLFKLSDKPSSNTNLERFKPSKNTLYAVAVFFILLLITNPSLKAFKEHHGGNYQYLTRKYNFLICSVYNDGAKEYFGVCENFVQIN